MTRPTQLVVTAAGDGVRLDRFLAGECPDYSRAFLQRLIADERVRVNGQLPRRRTGLHAGDTISVDWPDEESAATLPESFDLPILFQDKDILVIDKPAGLTVHPGAGTRQGTLVNALLGLDYEGFAAMLDSEQRPGIVHRLDKDTSGVLIVARHAQARARLASAFARRQVEKTYLAVVHGVPRPACMRLETRIGRHPVNRRKMAVVDTHGKPAVTSFETVATGIACALLEVRLETGRTHQIRVHLASLGHPILGDAIYGDRLAAAAAPRQMLHAWRLRIAHPRTGASLSFEAPPPDDFTAVCEQRRLTLPS